MTTEQEKKKVSMKKVSMKKVSMKKGSIKLWDREGALVETPASLSQGFAIVKTNFNYPWQLYIVNKDGQGVLVHPHHCTYKLKRDAVDAMRAVIALHAEMSLSVPTNQVELDDIHTVLGDEGFNSYTQRLFASLKRQDVY